MRVSSAAIAVTLLAVLCVQATAAVAQTSSTYLTTGLSPSGGKWTQIGGYNGVLVNFTSSYSSTLIAVMYVSVVNTKGQTVSWSQGGCTLSPGNVTGCFVAFTTAFQVGIWTAHVFATTTNFVAVSDTYTVNFAIKS